MLLEDGAVTLGGTPWRARDVRVIICWVHWESEGLRGVRMGPVCCLHLRVLLASKSVVCVPVSLWNRWDRVVTEETEETDETAGRLLFVTACAGGHG